MSKEWNDVKLVVSNLENGNQKKAIYKLIKVAQKLQEMPFGN